MDIYVQNRDYTDGSDCSTDFLGLRIILISFQIPQITQITGIIIYPQINANYTQIILSDIYVIFTRIGGGKRPRIARIIIYPQINANYAQIIY